MMQHAQAPALKPRTGTNARPRNAFGQHAPVSVRDAALSPAQDSPSIMRRFARKVWNRLRPLASPRFLKFCSVGVAGIVVNLGALWVLSDVFLLHTNAASAIAIELSIISNFFLNEYWTFRDRRHAHGAVWQRGVRFHLVSLVGAVMQWAIFVLGNIGWLWLTAQPDAFAAYFAVAVGPGGGGSSSTGSGSLLAYALHAVRNPPHVGALKYLSQLCGIGVAVVWNFLANFYWTWRPAAAAPNAGSIGR